MEEEKFRPTLDWGNELGTSLTWVLKYFVGSAVCLLIVLLLVGIFTVWGRQFWRISGDYFKGRESIPVWAMLAVLLLSVVLSVRLNVLVSYYGNDLMTSLQ